MGVKAASAYLHVPFVKKARGLNLLEPCGPVQVCNGTALSFFYGEVYRSTTGNMIFVRINLLYGLLRNGTKLYDSLPLYLKR